MIRRYAPFAAVLLVLAVVYLTAWATGPVAGHGRQAAGPQTTAVTSVTQSCPPPGPGTGEARIAMLAMPAQVPASDGGSHASDGGSHASDGGSVGTTGAGAAVLRAIPAAADAGDGHAPSSTVDAPGTLTAVTPPQAARLGGTQIDASGRMAEGFEAEEATSDGMGTVACAHPGSDMWFVGTGQGAGASAIRLYLMNTSAVTASVDVTMLTDAGLQPGLSSGITVPPHQYLTEDIAPLVKGSAALALNVQTTSGQVTADVWEGSGTGGAWLPVAAAPATRLVIPGLTASGGARLFVTVPGTADAQVKVTALTAQGRFLPFGTTAMDAPSGATSSFPLASLGASAAAIELTSNVPVTAGVLLPGNGVGAFTTAAAPVTEQGVLAGNPAGDGMTVGLLLSAPDAAVRASIAVVPASTSQRSGHAPAPRLVTIEPGHTVAVPVSPPGGASGPFAIVVTPRAGSGPLYGARVVTSGGGLSGPVASLLPLPSALTRITLPSANDTYSAIQP